jgi:hypothetical protein
MFKAILKEAHVCNVDGGGKIQNSNSDLTEGEIKKSKSQVLLSHTAVHVLRIIN